MKIFIKKSGSALILVLWSVALMTVAILGVVELVNSSLSENTSKSRQFRARLLAESGLAISLHPDVSPNEKILTQTMAQGPVEKFEARLTSESGRVNINALIMKILPPNNQREAKAELDNLLRVWRIETLDRQTVIDSLLDWVDPNDTHRLNGAERQYYTEHGHPTFPSNKPFKSVDELRYVRGMDEVAKKKPDWRDSFTIWGDGKVSINYASVETIQVIAGVSPYQAQSVVKYRNGPDGKPFTKDDLTFTNMTDVLRVMGFAQGAQSDLNRLNERLSLEDKIWRIESIGSVGNYKRKITLIADRLAKPPQFLEWLEQ